MALLWKVCHSKCFLNIINKMKILPKFFEVINRYLISDLRYSCIFRPICPIIRKLNNSHNDLYSNQCTNVSSSLLVLIETPDFWRLYKLLLSATVFSITKKLGKKLQWSWSFIQEISKHPLQLIAVCRKINLFPAVCSLGSIF